ncbi:Ig-like domain-containing protein [uncultured Shewanella sp.]|uniref:Ig-like domain-containing protein n=1 Tax=uncultured Shewanella sp. TaxID=173975 RepID=UPI0026188393|nr:Ig-like domain-containing protein [uncultured Shewanella sp.]
MSNSMECKLRLLRFISVSLLMLLLMGCGGSADSDTSTSSDTTSTSSDSTSSTSSTDDTATASTDDTVITINLDSITLNHEELLIAAGESIQLAATANYSDNTSADITEGALWASSDDAIAKVSEAGLVTGLSDGEVTITVSQNDMEKTVKVLVSESGVAEAIGRIGGSFLYALSRNPLLELQSLDITNEAIAQLVITEFGHTAETKASGIAHLCARLLEGTARNPSMTPSLTSYYDDFVQKITSLTLTSEVEFMLDLTHQIAIIRGAQIIHTARNPSLRDYLDDIANDCIDFINDVTPSTDLTYMQDTAKSIDSRRAKAIGILGENLLIAYSRNPSVESFFVDILNKALMEIELANQHHNIEHKAAGISALCSGLIVGVSRNPSLTAEMSLYYDHFLQEINSLASSSNNEMISDLIHHKATVQQAQLISTSNNPSLSELLNEIATNCITSIDEIIISSPQHDPNEDIVSHALAAKGIIGSGLLYALSRNPAIEVMLTEIATNALAQIDTTNQNHTIESRANGIASLCEKLIEGLARNPLLIEALEKYHESLLLEINAIDLSSYDKSAQDLAVQEAIIRQAQIIGTATNPPQAELLKEVANTCIGILKGDFALEDIEEI